MRRRLPMAEEELLRMIRGVVTNRIPRVTLLQVMAREAVTHRSNRRYLLSNSNRRMEVVAAPPVDTDRRLRQVTLPLQLLLLDGKPPRLPMVRPTTTTKRQAPRNGINRRALRKQQEVVVVVCGEECVWRRC